MFADVFWVLFFLRIVDSISITIQCLCTGPRFASYIFYRFRLPFHPFDTYKFPTHRVPHFPLTNQTFLMEFSWKWNGKLEQVYCGTLPGRQNDQFPWNLQIYRFVEIYRNFTSQYLRHRWIYHYLDETFSSDRTMSKVEHGSRSESSTSSPGISGLPINALWPY